MKVEVINRYIDRDSKSMCVPGKVLDYSDKRAKELISSGYVKAAGKLAEKPDKAKTE